MANNISIKVLESDRVLVAQINKSLAKELDKRFRKKAGDLKLKLQPIISTALFNSPEINSLRSGVLRFDFGLTGDPGPQIVNAVVQSVQVKINPVNGSQNGIKGGVQISIQPSDYSNLLSLPVAQQALEIEARIPWLEWLLTAGDSIIVAHYGVEYGAGLGRSGGAHMVGIKDAPFGPFKVNSAFSGNVNDNFITRSLNRSETEIKNVITGVFA
jgi:hypothetical protein